MMYSCDRQDLGPQRVSLSFGRYLSGLRGRSLACRRTQSSASTSSRGTSAPGDGQTLAPARRLRARIAATHHPEKLARPWDPEPMGREGRSPAASSREAHGIDHALIGAVTQVGDLVVDPCAGRSSLWKLPTLWGGDLSVATSPGIRPMTKSCGDTQ